MNKPVIKKGTKLKIGDLEITVEDILDKTVLIRFPDNTTGHLMHSDIENGEINE